MAEYFCANILKSGHWPRMRCLKIFYFSALVSILFNGEEPLRPSWIFDRHNFSLFRSRSHPVATEQVLAQSDLKFEKRCRKLIFKVVAVVAILDFSISSFSCFVSHKRTNAHHHFSNFGRSPVPEDLCKGKAQGLIWFWRRRFLKVFTIYGHGSHLGQWIATILAIFLSPT